MERVKYDQSLMLRDMAARGWSATELAKRAEPPVAISSVTRFLNGQHQTPKMARRLARALGRSPARYVAAEARAS
jgi:plasmid maintenance system antidote protein VapI